ncbi:THG1 [[Candida] subhashii]|uniref:tRNA(His) guanylyltransferase n=1 Tax=[Candida] subhashii TaxID=561895 RepID=A0A8J5UJ01_9ASCO|nr:THG1 [[Candida] subhashii]KAG7660631.1 THG1 [[Candida] subhashii]
MANSRFEYVKQFERENYLLPDTYIIIRVDGKGFHKFSQHYQFEKPNDARALQIMNRAAHKIMSQYSDVMLGYGDSDEYSFLLRRGCELYERREMKLCTLFASLMTCYYQFFWREEYGEEKRLDEDHLPVFDGRAVVYPTFNHIRDYFSWRQVDCHINNLYNTTFWNLVIKKGMTPQEAEQRLMGTVAADKNEILFSELGTNYNNEPEMFKKGTIYVKEYEEDYQVVSEIGLTPRQKQRLEKKRKKAKIVQYHIDIINDNSWWDSKPWLME